MKHFFNRSVDKATNFARYNTRVRYCCPHCGKRFRDKAAGTGVLHPECPRCGTTVTDANKTRLLDRTRRVGKWASVPVWGPLWILIIGLGWRVGVKRVGAFGLDYGLRLAKIRSISRRERDALIEKTAEAVAEKMMGARPNGLPASMKNNSECQIACMGCPARKKCPRKMDGFLGTFVGMSVANPKMAELKITGAPGVHLCPPSQLYEAKNPTETSIHDVYDENSAGQFYGRRVLIVTNEGKEVETTIDYHVKEGADGNPQRPWVCGKHIVSPDQIIKII
jgi:ribosomal protein L37AE/L43A